MGVYTQRRSLLLIRISELTERTASIVRGAAAMYDAYSSTYRGALPATYHYSIQTGKTLEFYVRL
jgi:hypothetical protein